MRHAMRKSYLNSVKAKMAWHPDVLTRRGVSQDELLRFSGTDFGKCPRAVFARKLGWEEEFCLYGHSVVESHAFLQDGHLHEGDLLGRMSTFKHGGRLYRVRQDISDVFSMLYAKEFVDTIYWIGDEERHYQHPAPCEDLQNYDFFRRVRGYYLNGDPLELLQAVAAPSSPKDLFFVGHVDGLVIDDLGKPVAVCECKAIAETTWKKVQAGNVFNKWKAQANAYCYALGLQQYFLIIKRRLFSDVRIFRFAFDGKLFFDQLAHFWRIKHYFKEGRKGLHKLACEPFDSGDRRYCTLDLCEKG